MLHQEHFRFSHHSKERPCASVDLAACQHARTTVTMSVSRDRNSVVLNRAIMQQVETWWAEVYENRVYLEYPLFVQATVPLRLIGVDTTIANSSLSENEFFFLEEFTETYKAKLEGDFYDWEEATLLTEYTGTKTTDPKHVFNAVFVLLHAHCGGAACNSDNFSRYLFREVGDLLPTFLSRLKAVGPDSYESYFDGIREIEWLEEQESQTTGDDQEEDDENIIKAILPDDVDFDPLLMITILISVLVFSCCVCCCICWRLGRSRKRMIEEDESIGDDLE